MEELHSISIFHEVYTYFYATNEVFQFVKIVKIILLFFTKTNTEISNDKIFNASKLIKNCN